MKLAPLLALGLAACAATETVEVTHLDVTVPALQQPTDLQVHFIDVGRLHSGSRRRTTGSQATAGSTDVREQHTYLKQQMGQATRPQ
jgi:hypothetical protein